MTELFQAHNEWRDRPRDERFETPQDLRAALAYRQSLSETVKIQLDSLRFETDREKLLMTFGGQSILAPTNWAFTQLCGYLNAPASFVRDLPAENAASDLNFRVGQSSREELLMLYQHNGSGLARAFTTPKYQRVWDTTTVDWVLDMAQLRNWERPKAKDEDERGPAGLYAGDRNTFVFMTDPSTRFDDGTPEGLSRGFFCWNSEVRERSYGFLGFLYRYICGNHIVWGATSVFEASLHHYGKNMQSRAEREFKEFVTKFVTAPDTETKMIRDAMGKQVAKTTEDVVTYLRRFDFLKKDAEDIVAQAENTNTDPTNLWDIVNAITSLSQKQDFADGRAAWDVRAGKILQTA